jgi:surface antigen
MKYAYITLLLLFSSMVYAADGPKLNDRDSLQFIFGKLHEDVNRSLTDNEFFIHLKGLEYALSTIGDQSEVEWSSSTTPLTGKVAMLSTKEEKGTVCKNFMETLTVKDKKYEGNGIACIKDGQWTVQK